MTKIGERAVVLGASMAGLLAARVLTDYYTTVTVVERDTLPVDVAQRRATGFRRRGVQLQPDLWPGHDCRGPGGGGVA